MDKRTVASAHERIDGLEKDLFSRVKRMEAIMIGTTGFIIALLVAVLTKMG